MARERLKKFVSDYFAGGVTCRELTEAITDYLEGHLSFQQRIRFQVHLGLCLGCRRYLRQMKHTITLLGKLPEDPLPPAIREEILHRFRTWKSSS
jgi:hypothetical protein